MKNIVKCVAARYLYQCIVLVCVCGCDVGLRPRIWQRMAKKKKFSLTQKRFCLKNTIIPTICVMPSSPSAQHRLPLFDFYIYLFIVQRGTLFGKFRDNNCPKRIEQYDCTISVNENYIYNNNNKFSPVYCLISLSPSLSIPSDELSLSHASIPPKTFYHDQFLGHKIRNKYSYRWKQSSNTKNHEYFDQRASSFMHICFGFSFSYETTFRRRRGVLLFSRAPV